MFRQVFWKAFCPGCLGTPAAARKTPEDLDNRELAGARAVSKTLPAQVFGKDSSPGGWGTPAGTRKELDDLDNSVPAGGCSASKTVSWAPTMEVIERALSFHSRDEQAAIFAPVYFIAARAAVKECPFWSKVWPVIVMYRVQGLVANCAFLGILLWWVKPIVVFFLFVLLWYIPAVFRSGLTAALREKRGLWKWQLWVTPLQYPILLFVADDFSWLRMHPHQRHKVLRLHVIYVIRVVLMLWLVLEGVGGLSRAIINDDSSHRETPLEQIHDAFDKVLYGSSAKYLLHTEWAHFVTVFWAAIAEGTLCLSALWVGVTSCLIVAMLSGCLKMEKDEELLERVHCIAKAIQEATTREDPLECKKKLLELSKLDRAAGGCPTIQLTSPFWPPSANPYFIAGQYVLHSIVRLLNVYTYLSSRTFAGLLSGGILLGHVASTAFASYKWGLADPRVVCHEVQLSSTRGIFTQKVFELLKTDKGVLTLPALIFLLGALPRAIYLNGHGPPVQAGMAVMQIALVVGGLVSSGTFAFEQFDLGVEREGKDRHGRWDPEKVSVPVTLSP